MDKGSSISRIFTTPPKRRHFHSLSPFSIFSMFMSNSYNNTLQDGCCHFCDWQKCSYCVLDKNWCVFDKKADMFLQKVDVSLTRSGCVLTNIGCVFDKKELVYFWYKIGAFCEVEFLVYWNKYSSVLFC